MTNKPAFLVLADGSVFPGIAFGASAVRGGEVVFNTAHSGYQEVITDPSYCGQIVCMTNPLQGNYGVNPDDDESARPFIEGFVVRELSPVASNFRAREALDAWLERWSIPGIAGLDTRALTLRLRETGAINGIISTSEQDVGKLRELARALPSMAGQNLVPRVAPREAYQWTEGFPEGFEPPLPPRPLEKHVVAIDCGMKRNILRNLVRTGCRVTVVPPTTSTSEILALQPDGVFISNGPGDPAAATYLHQTLRDLTSSQSPVRGRSSIPVFGICLGHQLLALALGAKTYKLKFGHHGYNHPVKNLLTGRVEITSQNHGFAVDPATLPGANLEATHVNLYDHTNEGFVHRELPVFAVQYHPEAAPGPHDAAYLFDVFRSVIETGRPPTADQMAEAQAQLASGAAV